MSVAFLRKYGTGTGADIYVPLLKRGVVDYAVSADFTPAAGDVKVSLDGGAAANIGTLPTAVAMGNTAMWKFVFSNAELSCKVLSVTLSDSATKAVEDQMFVVETYGNAAAMYKADLSATYLPANVMQWAGAVDVTLDVTTSYPVVTLQPDETILMHRGTAQASGNDSTHIKLAAGASAVNDRYKGQRVKLTGSTGAGQSRLITAYDGTTKIATVDWAFDTTPDGTTTYAVQLAGTPKLDSGLKVTPIDIDGITHASAMEALLAVVSGVATVSGSDILFRKRDGTTTKITVTVGGTPGQRTASVINS